MNNRGLHSSRVIWLNVVWFSQDVQFLSEGYELVQVAREAHIFVDIYVHHDVYEDKIIILNCGETIRSSLKP